MVDFTPVEYDPFGADQANNVQLTPVDYDPFKGKSKYYLATHGIDTAPSPQESEAQPNDPAINRLFGLQGQERYQLFPERIAKSVGRIMTGKEQPYDPSTGQYNIEGAMNVAGLMGGATLGAKPVVNTLGSGAMRQMAKNEVVPVFHSAVENAVNLINQPKMTGQQWLGTLSNKPGVKPEEMQFTGLKNFLEENADKLVTKQEVQNFVNENKVQVNEINKGKTDLITKPNEDEPHILEVYRSDDPDGLHSGMVGEIVKSGDRYIVNVPELQRRDFASPEQAKDFIAKNTDIASTTKYQSYQLPGGENYREKLFTLPSEMQKYNDFTKELRSKYGQGGFNNLPLTKEERLKLDNLQETAGDEGVKPYQSPHWDEPNVLAHVRMNDRSIPNEGFAVQNIKSGNKRSFDTQAEAEAFQKTLPTGYETKIVPSTIPKKSLHIEEIQSDWHQAGRDKGYRLSQQEQARLNELANKKDAGTLTEAEKIEGQQLAQKSVNDSGVPDAPFKKTWPDLVIKRMVREAAEKGYDKLSWTPGEAQAARYDLSKQVDTIQATKNPNGTFNVQYRPLNDAGFHEMGTGITKERLADSVGKDLAEKIINQEKETQSYKGLDLKVGGEGMKGFYDQIIPKIVEKITGQKVKTSNIEGPGKYKFNVYDGEDNLLKTFDDRIDAQKFINENPRTRSFKEERVKDKIPVHYIDIPQKLKDTALQKGFPLFSGGVMLTPVDHNPFQSNQNEQ